MTIADKFDSVTSEPYPRIGVGTWSWGNQLIWGYNTSQDGQLEACFRRALELGLCFFDTADSYGTGRLNGRSELLLGSFCAALPELQRRPITVATKLAPFPWRIGRRGFTKAFAASYRRLQGKLDRVQLHWSTARYVPWQETPLLEGLADLVQQGLVGEMGVSNMGPCRIQEVHRHLSARGINLRSVQIQMSLLSPEAIRSQGIASLCAALGIELIAYSPLALGLLGRWPGESTSFPPGIRGLVFRRLWPKIQPILHGIAKIATERRVEPAAVALNWCRSHGAVPIVGMRNPYQAEMAAAALGWQLNRTERVMLDQLALSTSARMPINPFQSP